MKNRMLLVLLAVMLALSVGSIGCEQPPADVVVSEIGGNLTVRKEGAPSWTEAEVGMALESTDTIKCGDNSSAEITFLNGDTVELGAGTELQIAELIVSTETDSAIIRLKLIIGSIIFRVVNIVDAASVYEVETPTGEVAVRGSVVQIAVSEDGTTSVCNLEGDIWAIAQGVELQVPEGECCVIRSGEPPQLVVVFPDPNLEAAIREAIDKPTGDIYASDLEGLTSLYASERNITDLTGLGYCTSLTGLDLRGNEISDISALADLTSLTRLGLSENQITDVSALANLTSLKWLLLEHNNISDIAAFANLINLTHLYLWANQVSDVWALASLSSLTTLALEENQISDISALGNLSSLAMLNLDRNEISDVSPLADLSGLEQLYLEQNQISDISPLTDLTNLTRLNLWGNEIIDVSPLGNLTGLTFLVLGRNEMLTDISPLSNLANLEILHIGGSGITDISSLAGLTQLTWFDCSSNHISDISPLVDNEGLSEGDEVYLSDNPLSSDSVNIYIPQLEARGVNVEY